MSNSEIQVIAPLSDAKNDEKKMKRRNETKKKRRAAAAAQGNHPCTCQHLSIKRKAKARQKVLKNSRK